MYAKSFITRVSFKCGQYMNLNHLLPGIWLVALICISPAHAVIDNDVKLQGYANERIMYWAETTPTYTVKYKVSFDGGQNWGSTNILFRLPADFVVADFGGIHSLSNPFDLTSISRRAASIAVKNGAGVALIYTVISEDYGLTWGQPTVVLQNPNADFTGCPGLYMEYDAPTSILSVMSTIVLGGVGYIFYSTSTDDGTTWDNKYLTGIQTTCVQ